MFKKQSMDTSATKLYPYLSIFADPENGELLRPFDKVWFWRWRWPRDSLTVSCESQLASELSEPCRPFIWSRSCRAMLSTL